MALYIKIHLPSLVFLRREKERSLFTNDILKIILFRSGSVVLSVVPQEYVGIPPKISLGINFKILLLEFNSNN